MKPFSIAENSLELKALAQEKRAFDSDTANMNFRGTVWAHIKRLGITPDKFYELTLLDDRQFRKFKTGSAQSVTFDTAIAVCIGLDLGLEYGESLLAKAGYTLDNQENLPYKMCLVRYRGQDIFSCNEYLKDEGARLVREKESRALTGF